MSIYQVSCEKLFKGHKHTKKVNCITLGENYQSRQSQHGHNTFEVLIISIMGIIHYIF